MNTTGSHQGPGQEPYPDDQGPDPVCTRFAISKGVCRGHHRGYFPPHQKIDFEQKRVTKALNR